MIRAFSKLSLALIMMMGFSSHTVQAAAATPDIQVVVNNSRVYAGVTAYVDRGTTMIPIKALQYIPGNSTIWNNITQTVTVSQDGNVITLVIGQTTARINNRTVELPIAPTIREGRAMVPLRFIAEAAQASVYWNSTSRMVYVAKTPEQTLTQLNSENLSVAREAAVSMPRISRLRAFQPSDDSNAGYRYYFPEGQAFPFFEQRGDVVSYYEMRDNHSELIWTAKMNLEQQSEDNLFFLPYSIEREDGVIPSFSSRIVFYDQLTLNGASRYGYIDPAARTTTGTSTGESRFQNIPNEEVKK